MDRIHEAQRLAMKLAIVEAERFAGATSPNPPVGAAALDAEGNILCVRAHEKAGSPHAEALVIEECAKKGLTGKLHTIVVTLEPCNHHGRTPPCAETIAKAGLKRVMFGAPDRNPHVAGGGSRRLEALGLSVHCLSQSNAMETKLRSQCESLVAAFMHWANTGRPFVTVKTAMTPSGSMIPPTGQKTFTSLESLRFAHELRKRSDAILTGSGTVLADWPKFTVRHVADHPGKQRWLVVLDRRHRIPPEWINRAKNLGFLVETNLQLDHVLPNLGSKAVLEVLVEAGPTLSEAILSSSLWDRHVVITQSKNTSEPDRIDICLRESLKEQGK